MKYVAGFLFSEDRQKVLLIQKNKPEWQKGLLNGVGGKIEEFDETPTAAMIREFKEEAALDIIDWEPVVNLIGERNGELTYKVDFFCAYDDKIFEAQAMTDEQLHIVDTFSLPQNVIFNLRWLIPMCLDDNVSKPTDVLDIQGN